MSSRRLRVSENAARDIRSILRFTERTWGVSQREEFTQLLYSFLEELRSFPEIGPGVGDVHLKTRTATFRMYTITYTINDSDVYILRIQHQKMIPAPNNDS